MRSHQPHRRLRAFAVLLSILAAAVVLAGPGLAGAAKTWKIHTANNAKLHKTILVNHKGLTLYTLSNEGPHKIVCKSVGCLSAWPPLKIAKGVKPVGAKHLGVIKRGKYFQVTWKGKPLYTFAGDHKKGDVNGEGLKDVGVWHVAAIKASTTTSQHPTTTTVGTGTDTTPTTMPPVTTTSTGTTTMSGGYGY
jgi:predicted lipoprotein with Yx(FWY)xxD motif